MTTMSLAMDSRTNVATGPDMSIGFEELDEERIDPIKYMYVNRKPQVISHQSRF